MRLCACYRRDVRECSPTGPSHIRDEPRMTEITTRPAYRLGDRCLLDLVQTSPQDLQPIPGHGRHDCRHQLSVARGHLLHHEPGHLLELVDPVALEGLSQRDGPEIVTYSCPPAHRYQSRCGSRSTHRGEFSPTRFVTPGFCPRHRRSSPRHAVPSPSRYSTRDELPAQCRRLPAAAAQISPGSRRAAVRSRRRRPPGWGSLTEAGVTGRSQLVASLFQSAAGMAGTMEALAVRGETAIGYRSRTRPRVVPVTGEDR